MGFIPNTTPTPNWLYNGEMKKMNETELKVVLLVTRKTLGWFDPMTQERKQQDYISQSQFMEFTGQSNWAIAKAIQSSVESGWIIARDREGKLCDTSSKRRRRRVWYQLGGIFTDRISNEEISQDENLSNISKESKQHSSLNLSNIPHNTKETITKETIQKELAVPSTAGKINLLIDLFKDVNPSFRKLFRNTTQRQAVERLLKIYTYEQLEKIITILSQTNDKQYAPLIITPLPLEDKIGLLRAYIKRHQPNKIISI